MTIPEWLAEFAQTAYDAKAYQDYGDFVRSIESLVKAKKASPTEAKAVLARFSNPNPTAPVPWEDDGEQVAITDPPDPGPLSQAPLGPWLDEARAEKLRLPPGRLRGMLGIKDLDAVKDVQENALRILGRSAEPRAGSTGKQGLVYGMVQSGKTASMIALIMLAQRAGYRLFIILAGDKVSLREQTQYRVNKAFDLDNGANRTTRTHSPTWDDDFGFACTQFESTFRYREIREGKDPWTTIIVVKKNTNHLHQLIGQIEQLDAELKEDGHDFKSKLPALILDDEVDYASQNTQPEDREESIIHSDIKGLRAAIPLNTYVGYTATPQACIAADPADSVGYPRDFIWLLEPFMEEGPDGRRTRSYLGAWEIFWEYDDIVLHTMGPDDWPHYVKDDRGRTKGIHIPPKPPATNGRTVTNERLPQVEADYLEEVLAGERPELHSIRLALFDFILGCATRWWRVWRKEGGQEKPSKDRIEREYPHHAAMIHLSALIDNQERIQDLVQKQWTEVVRIVRGFNPAKSTRSNRELAERWRLLLERTRRLFPSAERPTFAELHHFIESCIEIASRPIKAPVMPYRDYPGSPYVYRVNSAATSMELFYGPHWDREVLTKKAAIIVGGNVLSRGLTIEGLSVTVFGRTAQQPLGDATLQMGRWFGHHMGSLDLISIFMQDQNRETLSELARADRDLRQQIKESIIHNNPPDKVLLEMWNSPFFRVTSPSKARRLKESAGGVGYSGRRVALTTPSFRVEDIAANAEALGRFERAHRGEPTLERATLYRDVPAADVFRLFESLRCPDDAEQTTFGLYSEYLRDWWTGRGTEYSAFPALNVAVLNEVAERQRICDPKRPASSAQARRTVTREFGNIVGGPSDQVRSRKRYQGDAFLDKDSAWHQANTGPAETTRTAGEPLLIAIYRLEPNYVCRGVHPNGGASPAEGGKVWLGDKDKSYVPLTKLPEGSRFVVSFAAWTPKGGPLYAVLTNTKIDRDLRQRGHDRLASPEEA